MDNNNGTRPQGTDEESYTLTLKRHEVIFLTEALKDHRSFIRYCLMRSSEISFIDSKQIDNPLNTMMQKYYHNLDMYMHKLFKVFDKFLHPYMY